MRYLHLPSALPPEQSLPPVLFVHGLMGYSFSWRHNLEVFARQREVYAVDLLGIGHSDRPETGAADFGLKAAAQRVLELMRGLGHPSFDLVGTSHGGAVAMLAASYDRRFLSPLIRRMVLVAPANPFMSNARFRLAFFRSAVGRALLRWLGPRGGTFRGKALGRMYGDESRITDETRAGYEVNFRDRRSYEYALEVVRSWSGDMEKLLSALPSIADLPVLLLWGGEDRAVEPESGLRLQELFRNAQYVSLPGIGHLPYEEAPEQFNQLVLRFLE